LKTGRSDDAREVAHQLLSFNQKAIEDSGRSAPPSTVAELWHEAHNVYWALGEYDRGVECAKKAVQAAPGQFRLHRELANRFAQMGDFSAAIEELKWCLRRAPNDSELQAQLLQWSRSNMTSSSPTARAPASTKVRNQPRKR